MECYLQYCNDQESSYCYLFVTENVPVLSECKTLRGQTVHSVHRMRIPQQAKIRFVTESTS